MMCPDSFPLGLVCYKSTPQFTHQNIPASLLSAHKLKDGVWGLLRVTSGCIRYCIDRSPSSAEIVATGRAAVIEPEILHHVELLDSDSSFFVEFYRAVGGD